VAIVVGIVIGSAIFETPSLVAANVGSGAALIGVWIAGAFVSLLGALCWAELASRYPDAGGDYHFLTRAWGRDLGFLYAWSRMAVIQSGSIALIAFVFGDYASQIVRLGNASAAIWAGAAVAVLTLLHLAGVGASKRGQRWLSVIQIGGIALLVLGGWLASSGGAAPAPRPSATAAGGSIGLAMVFVLLTYGGWNEAAFISAELRNPRKSVLRVLLASVATIAALYVLVNLAMLRTLGIGGMAASEAIGADLMRRAAGAKGATLVSLLVVACTLASINAMIFTGARTNYAMGRDFRMFSRLGLWRSGGDVPRNALLVQGAIILCLIAFGGAARNGFQAMVEYSAPVFWLFLLLATLSLLRLRQIEPARPREFSVPLYPVTPILFAAICAYLLYSSVRYTGAGALAGLAIVAVGAIVLLFERRRPAGRGNG
jgi:amino acid transporter